MPPEPAEVAHTPAELDGGGSTGEQVKTRFLLPLLLPVLSMVAVALYAINLSRVFLAGDTTSALIIASIVTVAILVGASIISATPRLRTSSLAMIVGLIFVIVMSAGLTTLGPSLGNGGEKKASGYQQPSGPAATTVEVVAQGSSLTFDPSSLTVPAGVVAITLVDGGGTHTLDFTAAKLAGFQLNVPGKPQTLKANFAPGTYIYYCAIPGHRAAGMQGTLTVTAADATATSTSSPSK